MRISRLAAINWLFYFWGICLLYRPNWSQFIPANVWREINYDRCVNPVQLQPSMNDDAKMNLETKMEIAHANRASDIIDDRRRKTNKTNETNKKNANKIWIFRSSSLAIEAGDDATSTSYFFFLFSNRNTCEAHSFVRLLSLLFFVFFCLAQFHAVEWRKRFGCSEDWRSAMLIFKWQHFCYIKHEAFAVCLYLLPLCAVRTYACQTFASWSHANPFRILPYRRWVYFSLLLLMMLLFWFCNSQIEISATAKPLVVCCVLFAVCVCACMCGGAEFICEMRNDEKTKSKM